MGLSKSMGTNMLALISSPAMTSRTSNDPNPTKLPRLSIKRGAGPMRMSGSGEYRFLEQIFPRAGKLAPRQHARRLRRSEILRAQDMDFAAGAQLRRRAERNGGRIQFLQRQHQAESRHLIVGQRVSRNFPAGGIGEPHVRGFRHQVADGQHQTARIDDHAVADALRSQNARGKGVLGNIGAQFGYRLIDRL